MLITKKYDEIDVRNCKLENMLLDENDRKYGNAVCLTFDGGRIVLERGQSATISVDEGTSSMCCIDGFKYTFNSVVISVVKDVLNIDVISTDGDATLLRYPWIRPKMADTYFGIQ